MLTLRALAPLFVAFIAAGLALYGATAVSRWWAGRKDRIDELIAANAFKSRGSHDGVSMDTVDWRKVEKAGEIVWQQTVRAQRKDRTQPTPGRVLKIADRCR